MTSEHCASCRSGDSLQLSTVYLALKHCFRSTSAHGTSETTFYTRLFTDITPESFYLCPACIAFNSATQALRQERSLRRWCAALTAVVLLWTPWVWTLSMDSFHICSGLFFFGGSCLTLSNILKKYLDLQVDLASGKPAMAAKEVCFQVCQQDYEILLKMAQQQREILGEHHMTTVEIACLTKHELMGQRRRDKIG